MNHHDLVSFDPDYEGRGHEAGSETGWVPSPRSVGLHDPRDRRSASPPRSSGRFDAPRGDGRPHGSNVAARIRPSHTGGHVVPEDEDDEGVSNGTLTFLALAAGVSVLAVVGVGVFGAGVLAAALAYQPQVAGPDRPATAVSARPAGAAPGEQAAPTSVGGVPVRQVGGGPLGSTPESRGVAAGGAPTGGGFDAQGAGSPAGATVGSDPTRTVAADPGFDPGRPMAAAEAPAPRASAIPRSGAAPSAGPSSWSEPVAAQPAPADDGWFSGVVAAGTNLVERMVGGGEEAGQAAPVASRGGSPSLAGASPELARVASASTPAAPAAAGAAPGAAPTSALSAPPGAPSDLLAGDDGLDALTADLGADRARNQPPPPDDAAMRMLAELDAPTPARGAAPTAVAESNPNPGAPAATHTAATSAPSPTAAAPAGTAPDDGGDGWFDALLSAGSELASAVTGSAPERPAAAPPAPVSHGPSLAQTMGVADPGTRSVPVDSGPAGSSAGQAPVDLLGDEDGLGLSAERVDTTGGFGRGANADDAAMRMLAELDAPSERPSAGLVAAATPGAPTGPNGSVGSTASSASSAPTLRPTDVPPPPPLDPAPAEDSSWLDSMIAIGSGIASMVTGEPAPAPARPSVAAASPSVGGTTAGPSAARAASTASGGASPASTGWSESSAPAQDVDLLADDDGLGGLDRRVAARTDATGGFGTAAPADDAAMRMLAELDADDPARPVARTAPAAASAPEPAPDSGGGDSWLDALTSVGDGIASFVSGVGGGGGGGARVAPATAAGTPAAPSASDGASLDALVGGLASDRQVPAVPEAPVEQPARTTDEATAALLAELDRPSERLPSAAVPAASASRSPTAVDVAPPTSRSAAAPTTQEDAGWFGSLLAAGSELVAAVSGTSSEEGLRPVSSEGSPGVDLLADDDGLGLGRAASVDRTGGFGTAAPADDAAMRMLAELDADTPARPSATRPGAVTSAASPSPSGSPASAGADPLFDDPAPRSGFATASAPAPTAAADDTSWLDTITESVSSFVGGSSGQSAARPSLAAATPPSSSSPQPRVDLLSGDDGLDGLVADLGTDRTGGFGTPAAPDDAALALLAELDAPAPRGSHGPSLADTLAPSSGASPSVASAARPTSVPPPPPAPAPAEDSSWFDTMLSAGSAVVSYVTGSSAAAPAPAASSASPSSLSSFLPAPGSASAARPPPPRPVVSSEGRPGVDLLAGPDDNLRRVGADSGPSRPIDQWENPTAPDPAMAVLASLDAPSGTADAGRAPVRGATAAVSAPSASSAKVVGPPPPPPAPRCSDGELCGDRALKSWRDPADGTDLLLTDELAVVSTSNRSVAELFYAPGAEESQLDSIESSLFSLRTYVVIVTTDVPGVPTEIDGKSVGDAPLVAEVAPGPHVIRLYDGNTVSEYTLRVDSDPEEWCFEGRGRTFKYVRCE